MSPTFIIVIMAIVVIALIAVVFYYLSLKKKMRNADVMRIEKLRQGTEESGFSMEVFYQKLYVHLVKTPFIKRYLLKVRRRLEINNLDDEFLTRQQSAQIIFKSLCIILPLTIGVIVITHTNLLLMAIILIFELFIIDSMSDGMVDKLDNALLLQQIDFFAAMRHAYHETNMVGEAIYSTAQDTENMEMSRQAEKIYDILNSQDPETELEKYYDVAPNNYIKEFAGISYLTQEFGDRKVDGTSLYLKNLENITQEMQIEILKRDKLNYTFQSLSIIAIVPMLILEPMKSWAINNFSFTKQFYEGKQGLIVQILIMIATFVCYILIRKLKDNGAVKRVEDQQNPWEAKLYNIPIVKKVVDLFMPKEKTKDYRKLKDTLKDAASKKKVSWLYVDRIVLAIVTFIVTLVFFVVLHKVEVNYIYTQPTSDYDLIGEMSDRQMERAMETTKRQNVILNKLRGKTNVKVSDVEKAMRNSKEYKDFSDEDISSEAKTILSKLKIINSEYLKWFEVLMALLVGCVGYAAPVLLLKFQVKMRQMEMEDEVMQYQTIIMMLMRLERVDVEMILEWLGRYADIFKEPINKCLNNYESGAWESLEVMKDEVSYEPFIRIIESLQTAVEKVPIKEAFDELDADREYYRDKRKESNARLISKKGMIGKAIGFAPMVLVFVGYLVVPLVLIGMTSLTTAFDSMSKMT